MRIVDIMSEDLVVADLSARTRDDVLGELVERIVAHAPTFDWSMAKRFLIERERIGSTGVTRGIAIPHARVPNLESPVACFGRSRDGVDFGALDKAPTHLFLTLLAPDGTGGLHLKALARASRLFKDPSTYEALMAAKDQATLWSALRERDERLSQ